ncbi:hypothetical protein BJ165DRAFT_1613480 [Panaeolus papilionaceus]|nr:hypothetical protein BJ165DRAFT_1613480 [Panaeolus papilionaceus]
MLFILSPLRLSYPPTSPLGNQDANKLAITNNGGDVVPVQPFSPGEAVVTSIERAIAPPMVVSATHGSATCKSQDIIDTGTKTVESEALGYENRG